MKVAEAAVDSRFNRFQIECMLKCERTHTVRGTVYQLAESVKGVRPESAKHPLGRSVPWADRSTPFVRRLG